MKILALITALFSFRKPLVTTAKQTKPQEAQSQEEGYRKARAALIELNMEAMRKMDVLSADHPDYEKWLDVLCRSTSLKQMLDQLWSKS
jgi:hypothetical protein